MIIDQTLFNKLSNTNEPRTKHVTASRLRRQAQYKASNAELQAISHDDLLLSIDEGFSHE